MSTATVQYLVARLAKADKRWDTAMAREGYRDDPDEADEEGLPFTEADWRLYGWADSWRLMVHRIENAIEATPEAASIRADHHSFVSADYTYVEVEQSIEHISRGSIETKIKKLPMKPKTIRRAK